MTMSSGPGLFRAVPESEDHACRIAKAVLAAVRELVREFGI